MSLACLCSVLQFCSEDTMWGENPPLSAWWPFENACLPASSSFRMSFISCHVSKSKLIYWTVRFPLKPLTVTVSPQVVLGQRHEGVGGLPLTSTRGYQLPVLLPGAVLASRTVLGSSRVASAPPCSSPDVSLKLHSWCRLELFHQSHVPGCSRTLDCRFHMKGKPIIDGFVCLFGGGGGRFGFVCFFCCFGFSFTKRRFCLLEKLCLFHLGKACSVWCSQIKITALLNWLFFFFFLWHP